jgi:hypothetical protein
MLEDVSYRRQQIIDVDAAVVGISRLRWVSAAPDVEREEARRTMEEWSFDVLPVDSEGQGVEAYYQTITWGDFSEIEKHPITYKDVINQHKPLDAVIQAFASEDRYHFFLSQNNRITGLISIVNLNCRQARIYIFSLLSELEIRLGRFIQYHVDDGALSIDEVMDAAQDGTQERYERDIEKGVEREVTEYLYVSEMINLIRKGGFHGALDYASKRQFAKDFNRLVKLRNKVTHPVRTLVNSPGRAKKLHRDVEVVERALFHLRKWSS